MGVEVAIQEFLTYSEMQTRLNCPQRWQFRYVDQIVPRVTHPALPMGSAFHKAIETGDYQKGLDLFDRLSPQPNDQAHADRIANDRATVEAMSRGALAQWTRHQGGQREVQFRVPVINPATGATSRSFILAGKIDAIVDVNGEWFLEELKTASQLNTLYVDRLQLDTQVTLYMYAAQRQWDITIAGVIYRVAKKPSIRQTQKETPAQYRERLIADYQIRPEFYFAEFDLRRSQDDLAHFESDLWTETQRMLVDRRLGYHPRNTSYCTQFGGCPYLPLCAHKPDAEALYLVQPPHSELLEEDEPHE